MTVLLPAARSVRILLTATTIRSVCDPCEESSVPHGAVLPRPALSEHIDPFIVRKHSKPSENACGDWGQKMSQHGKEERVCSTVFHRQSKCVFRQQVR